MITVITGLFHISFRATPGTMLELYIKIILDLLWPIPFPLSISCDLTNKPVNFLGKHKKKKNPNNPKQIWVLHLCISKKIWNVQVVSEKIFLFYVTEILKIPSFCNELMNHVNTFLPCSSRIGACILLARTLFPFLLLSFQKRYEIFAI